MPQYVMYFPPGKKYVALFVGEDDEATIARKSKLMELASKHRQVRCCGCGCECECAQVTISSNCAPGSTGRRQARCSIARVATIGKAQSRTEESSSFSGTTKQSKNERPTSRTTVCHDDHKP